ncbi:unnamed protein product, partial [Dracunculus medinensis]|uniref:ShKT domain-containing protein n=1 Tax=Dracunculus medinensis TaxID=318479 RepID=A0A0N4UR47_DRAME
MWSILDCVILCVSVEFRKIPYYEILDCVILCVSVEFRKIPYYEINANAAVVRPSVPVANCQDRDAAACYEIFKPDNPGVTFANNLMPNQNYQVLDKCQQEPYIMLARQMCPWMCATCCMTKEYNCENATTLPSSAATCRDARQHCAAIRA